MHDVTVAYASAGIPQVYGPPGASGTLPLLLGAPIAESFPGPATTEIVPFSSEVKMSGLCAYSDVQAFWREYQFLALEVEVQFLAGQSFNPSIGSPVPELHLYTDPTDSTPPSSVIQCDRYGDSQRIVLSAEKTVRFQCQPKPTQQVYLVGVASAYATPASTKDLWLSTVELGTPHYSFKGLIRNFCSIAGSGAQVRFSFVAYLHLRRSQ